MSIVYEVRRPERKVSRGAALVPWVLIGVVAGAIGLWFFPEPARALRRARSRKKWARGAPRRAAALALRLAAPKR